ncbi:MAG TPA: FecR domain-containing protein [Polyangiaceae bacterium]|nr:FecR domain-containing protein [Polyangiaceae bacterium]
MTTGSTPQCPRLFEVEASRDGRLSGEELTRFRAHLGGCRDCAREAQALEALASDLRGVKAGAAGGDELRVRRERTRLLAAFDVALVPAAPESVTRRGRAVMMAFGALAACFVALFWWHERPRGTVTARTNAAAVPSAESVTVRADSSARWTRQLEAHLEKIVLESGALSIRVDRTRAQRRLLVILPDGELEDIGTTFSVSADGGHTTRVTVQEGSVVLRVRGNATIVLAAGDAWTRTPPPLALPPAAPPGPSSSFPSAKLPPAARLTPSPSGRASDQGPGLDAEPVPSPPSSGDTSADFRSAMGEFNAGNYGAAAKHFGMYVTSHPGNPRAEDAAYLRVLAFQHSGNAVGTQQAARDYLSLFPNGFRRAEVEALAR